MNTEKRDSDRAMIDSELVASIVWSRLKALVPEDLYN
jgi:hypothetical protein